MLTSLQVALLFISLCDVVYSLGFGGRRIVGGKSIDITEVPYQVGIKTKVNFCGGAIISKDFVITGAHCTNRLSSSLHNATVIYDTSVINFYGSNVREVPVEYITVHPLYKKTKTDYDVAIVKTATPMPISDVIQPIKFDERIPQGGEIGKVSGWGSIYQSLRPTKAIPSKQLKMTKMKIISRKECKKAYDKHQVTKNMICALGKTSGSGICKGDSGGPLVIDGKLVGVLAWSIGCGMDRYPAVYISVLQMKDFIDEATDFTAIWE